MRFLLAVSLVSAVFVACSSRSDDELQAEFDAFVARNDSCAVAEECVVLSPECPLGCEVAVNVSRVEAVQEKAADLIDEYESTGQACAYDCASSGAAQCEQGHCALGEEAGADGGSGGGECTAIGCGPAFSARFEKTGAWEPGEYRVVVGLGGTDVDCTATLPLTCDAPFPCGNPDVFLLLEGCALEPSAHALGGIEINVGTPASVTVQIFHEEQSLATHSWQPTYVTSRPNGEHCNPECTTAPGETMAIP